MPVLDLTDAPATERYSQFVRSHPLRAVTQDLCWGLVKNDWAQEAVYLEEDGEIVAAMTVLVRKLPGGFSVLYAPRGPLVDWDDKSMVQGIVAQAQPLVKKHRAIMLKFDPEVRFDAHLDSWMRQQPGWIVKNIGATKDEIIQPRYNMIVYLQDEQGQPLDEAALMKKYDSKARNRVRSGIKRGLTCTHGRSDQDLATFHDLYSYMARRNEITSRELPYFHRMREAFGERMRVLHVHHEEDVLASSVTIDYYGKLYYLYAGSNDLKRNLSPNQVMNHELMLWGLETGAQQYDMGGVYELNTSDGLYLFKRAFCKADGATEYVGEVDIVFNKPLYAALNTLVPKLQRGRRDMSARLAQARKRLAARKGE